MPRTRQQSHKFGADDLHTHHPRATELLGNLKGMHLLISLLLGANLVQEAHFRRIRGAQEKPKNPKNASQTLNILK
jgi:hypothetical protein